MNLEYEFTEQDYIEYNLYHYQNSPSTKRLLLIQRYGVALLFMILAPLMHLISQVPFSYYLISFAIASIVWIVLFPKIVEQSMKKRILKMVEEGKRNYLFGRHELRITQDGIHGKTGVSETTWHRIERAVETEKHVLVYLNSITAFVVPKSAFGSQEEKDRFLEEVSRFK